MFAWGEDAPRGFWIKSASDLQTEPGIQHLNLGYRVTGLSAAHGALVFVKSNGNSFVIPGSRDGRRAGGKQKFVKGREKIQAACCRDDDNDVGDDVTLLSEKGNVFLVNTRRDNIPRPLQALRNIAVAQVACGSQHSVALTKDGQVFTWGQDSRGQLGLGGRMKSGVGPPELLGCLTSVPLVQVSAGGDQSFAVSVSGGVLGWGRNDHGQLGLGDTADRRAPTPVRCLNMKKTVHVSCGTDHTVVLTKNGAVFTFGSGQYGQLGHNSFRDELRPRLVAELLGAKVTKTACGRHHTLVLTDSNRVYSFGRGEQGQLGRGEESHPSVPLPVKLTHDPAEGLLIRNIYAGGNSSFVQVTTQTHTVRADGNVPHDSVDDMIGRWLSKHNSKSWKRIKREIHRTFSSISTLNRLFIDQSNDKHFQTSSVYSGLNLSLVQSSFEKLAKRESILPEVEAGVLDLVGRLAGDVPAGVEGLRVYLILNELLHAFQKSKCHQTSLTLAEETAAAVLRLPAESLNVVVDWWSCLSESTRTRHVRAWRTAVSGFLSSEAVPRRPGLRNLLRLFQHLYNANSRMTKRRRIPEKTFSMEINQVFLQEDLLIRRSMKDVDSGPLVLCNFPFVMDLKSKKYAFDIDATYTKKEHQGAINFWSFPTSNPYFELRLTRQSLLEGTLRQLTAGPLGDYKKPLVVYFDSDPEVMHVYKKDFFHRLFHEIFSAQPGAFMFDDSETLAWFPSRALTEGEVKFYFLFGFLCGLALYNDSIVHLPFPLVLFRKLLGIEPTMDDLIEFSPRVAKSLQDVLAYNEEDLEDLCMSFLINWGGVEVDLDPQNPEKPVTAQNKKEFVDAYVSHAFNDSVKVAFEAFEGGFFRVCDRDPVSAFRPEELQRVLVGQGVYDWDKLKQNAVCEVSLIYHIMPMFWEVFDELTEEQKKDFLWFLTGFRRVPVLGMDQVKMEVQVLQLQSGCNYDQHYPRALTCHSILYLPLYSSKEVMRERLTEALTTEEGLFFN